LVTCAGAFTATLTVSVRTGQLEPLVRESLRVQVLPTHVQPVPANETRVIDVGSVAVTVTVPLVGPAPAALLTATVYATPFCPCLKLPVWVSTTPSKGDGTVKFAVTEAFAFMIRHPDESSVPPLHELNAQPVAGVAVRHTRVPAA
jgi:hypothetical protein